jgi:CBS domain-containing protein
MNVAFFLIPKSHVAYLTEGCSFRHGMEKLRRLGYTAIPVVTRDGRYMGSVNEGDFLWNIMSLGSIASDDLEDARIDQIVSDRTPPVGVNTPVEELMDRLLDQNFVPVGGRPPYVRGHRHAAFGHGIPHESGGRGGLLVMEKDGLPRVGRPSF